MQDRSHLWRVLRLRSAALLVLIGICVPGFASLHSQWPPEPLWDGPVGATWELGSAPTLRNELTPPWTHRWLDGRPASRLVYDPDRPPIQFRGNLAFLHRLYVAMFALGCAGMMLPTGTRRATIIGLLGCASLVAFLSRLASPASDSVDAIVPGLGAYMAFAGFLGIAMEGLFAMRGRHRLRRVGSPPGFRRTVPGRLFALLILIALTVPEFVARTGTHERTDPVGRRVRWTFTSDALLLNETRLPPGVERSLSYIRGGLVEDVPEPETLIFASEGAWVHQVYVAALGLAAAGLVLPGRARRAAIVGILGLGSLASFLLGLDGLPHGRVGGDPHTLELGLGAWLAIAGFAGLAADGFLAMRRRTDPAVPVFE